MSGEALTGLDDGDDMATSTVRAAHLFSGAAATIIAPRLYPYRYLTAAAAAGSLSDFRSPAVVNTSDRVFGDSPSSAERDEN